MVCVVQNGSSTRTSACNTARSTFSCACAGGAIARAAANMGGERHRPSDETFPTMAILR